MRKLTEADVQFEIKIEPDDLEPEGNCQASGDDDLDRQAAREIREQLARGNVAAWCTIQVRAKWKNFEGLSLLGAVSVFGDSADEVCKGVAETIETYALKDVALERLNRQVREAFDELAD